MIPSHLSLTASALRPLLDRVATLAAAKVRLPGRSAKAPQMRFC
jgi:hypothetical protein